MTNQRSQMTERYVLDANELPSEGIVSMVAVFENRSPLKLTPLGRVTDPEALDALLTRDGGTNQVTLEYEGYEVTATADEIRTEKLGSR